MNKGVNKESWARMVESGESLQWAAERVARLDKSDVFYRYDEWPEKAKEWFTVPHLPHHKRGALLMFFLNNGMSPDDAYAVVTTGVPPQLLPGGRTVQVESPTYGKQALREVAGEAQAYKQGKQGGRNRSSQLIRHGNVWGYEAVDERGFRTGVWMKRGNDYTGAPDVPL